MKSVIKQVTTMGNQIIPLGWHGSWSIYPSTSISQWMSANPWSIHSLAFPGHRLTEAQLPEKAISQRHSAALGSLGMNFVDNCIETGNRRLHSQLTCIRNICI